jgi:ion channel
VKFLQLIGAIWADRFPPSHPRHHSLIEKILVTPLLAFRLFSLGNVSQVFEDNRRRHLFMDTYVVTFALVLTILLFVPSHFSSLGTAIAGYRIWDIVTYRLYFMFVKSQIRPWSVDILRRSLLIVLLNLYETAVGYATLYITVGNVLSTSLSKETISLRTPLSALYYSVITMFTVGYGDFVPGDDFTRFLAITQVFSSLVFLLFLVPALISMFSTEKAAQSD